MSLPALPPPVLVQDARGVEALAARLTSQPIIAVDTESNSLHAYRERVCVIQFSTPDADFVLDSIAAPQLQPLAPVFADPRIEKVFHAAEYDLICLKRDFGFAFARLFDTMVAARTLGWPQMGLASILEGRFGVTLNKRLQRSDWARRPLTREALQYAQLDTHYLIPLRHQLRQELDALGRWDEAREEFERLSGVTGAPARFDPDGFWRIAGARDLNQTQLAILKELHLFREQAAERQDRPPFKILGDKTLLAIAQNPPHTPADLKRVPGMTAGQMQRYQRGILDSVHRGLKARDAIRRPAPERVDEAMIERFDALRTWRKKKAESRRVESDVIIAREVLLEIARRAPKSMDELARVPGLMPWRLAQYGEEILRVIGDW